MTLKKIIFIIFLPVFIWGVECPEDYIEIKEVCYYKKHLDVLQDISDVNESLRGIEPQNIGFQEWKDGRLTYLYLGDHQLTTLPDSIGILTDLNNLDLRKNKITENMA